MFKIGIDVGGTFTDFAVWQKQGDDYGQIASHKEPTSRPDFSLAVIAGMQHCFAQAGITHGDAIAVVHGTTVSTNAVIERSQPPVALLTTEGFRDILGIARLRLDRPVDLFNRRPAPLVAREHVYTVQERLYADGTVETPLAAEALHAVAESLLSHDIHALAICFLHAHRNPAHEAQAVAFFHEHYPQIEVAASHAVWPEQSEYERATLTLLNVYVKRLMGSYIAEIERFLDAQYPNARLYITKSNGGIMSAAQACNLPIHTLLSGPAAGVTAAQTLGAMLGIEQLLTFDMGGTSADVSIVTRSRPLVTGQAQVGDFPLMMQVTAVEAIGAGGGSVIWQDGGVMRVGPRSASSVPGPACYGQGGTEPTLTDAYLVANYLSPRGLLGGRLALDRGLAEAALAPIAQALGLDVVKAAESAIAIASSNMQAKITPFLARVGIGASDLALMIFGGAGGIQGPLLASELNIRRIVIPRLPSVFCAFGAIVSDLVHDAVRTVHGEPLEFDALVQHYDTLAEEGRQWLATQSPDGHARNGSFHRIADMRYAAQSFTIPVDVGDALQGNAWQRIADAFHREHARLFGHSDPQADVAIDTLRVRTVGVQPKPRGLPVAGERRDIAALEHREIRLGGQWIGNVPVFQWEDIPVGWRHAGPAIIQQDLATVLVPSGYAATVGGLGDLELTKE